MERRERSQSGTSNSHKRKQARRVGHFSPISSTFVHLLPESHPRTASSMQRDTSPSRRPRYGRSASPEGRDYEAKGGGRSSSRQRSPRFYAQPFERDQKRERARDNGYRDRSQRKRGDEGYGERERERERAGERTRYEGSARRDREGDDGVGFLLGLKLGILMTSGDLGRGPTTVGGT